METGAGESTFRVDLPTGGSLLLAGADSYVTRQLRKDGWGAYEPEVLTVFLVLVKQASVFLDLGANIGWYSLLAKAANPQCRVIAFEPAPQVAQTLRDNLALNGISAVLVEEVAAGDVDGDVDLYISPTDTSSSTLKGFRQAVKTVRVPSVKLDSYVEDRALGKVDLLKIDVEGTEPRVLKGMARLVEEARPDIVCEVLPRVERSVEEALRALRWYNAYWIKPEGLIPMAQVRGDPEFKHLNYLFTPKRPDELTGLGLRVMPHQDPAAGETVPTAAPTRGAAPRDSEAGLKVLVYCDADLNLIDGSSIWTSSIAQVLARHPGAEVTLPLKRRLSRSLVTGPLEAQPNIKLFDPWAIGRANLPPDLGEWLQGRTLRAPDAAGLLAALDRLEGFDLILVRGLRLAGAVVDQPSLRGRIWVYLTDFTDEDAEALARIHARAERFLCQTRQLQEYVQGLLEVGPGKFLRLPPMIPDMPAEPPSFGRSGEKLVYVGKFAPLWRTDEMVEAMAEVRSRHPSAELHVAGDKIHDVPGFSEHMRQLLEQTEGVVWHRGMARDEVQALVRSCDLGCSWRHSDLDESLELSTKVLEYGAEGRPVLLNRTPMHEELLGDDYPLFCTTREEYVEAVARAFHGDEAYRTAARRVWEASRGFTFSEALRRLAPHLPQAPGREPAAPLAPHRASERKAARKIRVAVASHDWKFFHHIMAHIGEVADFEVRVDEWKGVSPRAHDERSSRELAEWADVAVAEWCLGNAVWYSRNLGPGARLIIRLHRFELDRKYPEWLNQANVHRIVAVSPVFAERIRARLPSLAGSVVYIPNTVDCDGLDRPKCGNSEFRLGLLSVLPPRRKRPDLALDILERLRRRDSRYLLSIKTQLPTAPEYSHIWEDGEERRYILDLMARINRSPWRDSVHFEPYGRDVPIWFRKIGFILSTSDDESFHMSVAEGMASGSVPVIRLREEVPDLYPEEYVFSDIPQAVDLIERIRAEPQGIAGHSERLKAYVRERYHVSKVAAAWEQLIRRVAEER